MIGQTISHYRIVSEIGAGGMGVVYKAEDLRLGRFAALKFLSPLLMRDGDAKRRLFDEARAASALDHANVCTIYDIEETPDGQVFIAMAYCEGETLKQRLERGPLPPSEAARIALQVARGLARAHHSGIVHRDVKPANIMVTADGEAKLLDFGIAKLSTGDMTQSASTLGTIAYMAPEQVQSRTVDDRSDVWALGVVLYEMLAGHRPFRGAGDYELLQAIVEGRAAPLPSTLPGTTCRHRGSGARERAWPAVRLRWRTDAGARSVAAAVCGGAPTRRSFVDGTSHGCGARDDRDSSRRPWSILGMGIERCSLGAERRTA